MIRVLTPITILVALAGCQTDADVSRRIMADWKGRHVAEYIAERSRPPSAVMGSTYIFQHPSGRCGTTIYTDAGIIESMSTTCASAAL